jgi:hypothetical protein
MTGTSHPEFGQELRCVDNQEDYTDCTPTIDFGAYGNNNVLPYTINYTLKMQWQPRNDLAVDMGYVGNRGRHAVIPIPFNEPGIATPSNPIWGETASYGWEVLNSNNFDASGYDYEPIAGRAMEHVQRRQYRFPRAVCGLQLQRRAVQDGGVTRRTTRCRRTWRSGSRIASRRARATPGAMRWMNRATSASSLPATTRTSCGTRGDRPILTARTSSAPTLCDGPGYMAKAHSLASYYQWLEHDRDWS